MNKKKILIYLILGVIIISIILIIFLIKNGNSIDKELAQCIGENSILYSSLTCNNCKYQKQIFGEYYELINEVDCFYETKKCIDADILGYPTWIINGQQNPGVKTIEQLKELTGC